jgi:plastocyanin
MTKRARVGFMGLAALLITGAQVPAATTVTWTNHDEEPHTITSTTGAFGSAGLSQDDTFTQTFTRPGRYAYFCALHPQMRAVVVVR